MRAVAADAIRLGFRLVNPRLAWRKLGGQATWDGKNLNGRRVKTGVYLVFCNDKYGDKTHITKLLFIH